MNEKVLSLAITLLLFLGMGIWVPFLEFGAELIMSLRIRKTPLQHYDVFANSSAAPRTLYSLLLNGASWPQWAQIDSFELESGTSTKQQNGLSVAQGIGAVRVFRTGVYKSREKILGLVQDRQMTYTILPRSVFRDYQATVELTPTSTGGTDVRWQGSFRMFLPGFAWLMRLHLARVTQRFVKGLARHAEGGAALAPDL